MFSIYFLNAITAPKTLKGIRNIQGFALTRAVFSCCSKNFLQPFEDIDFLSSNLKNTLPLIIFC